MDILQTKLNVIEWLTDYKGHVIQRENDRLVELRHKNGMVATMFTGKTLKSLVSKVDKFLDRKLEVIHKNSA